MVLDSLESPQELGSPDNSCLVVVPAFNEGQGIADLVERIHIALPGASILVIDDCSTDNTGEHAISAGATVVRAPINLRQLSGAETGEGAVRLGLTYAKQNGFGVVLTMDGDGQHDPIFAEGLVKPILAHDADLVIGSRFTNGRSGKNLIRYLGIGYFSFLTRLLAGPATTDPTSGFRAYGKRGIALFADDFPPDVRSILLAKRAGLRVTEVPIIERQRQSGGSSLRLAWYIMVETLAALSFFAFARRNA